MDAVGHAGIKSATMEKCVRHADGHIEDVTRADTKGGSKKNKGWN